MQDDHGSPVNPNRAEYMYMQVVQDLTRRIESGELAPGARLPGERDLAQEYAVAIGTARRAVKELRALGLVITLPAKGTYIAQQDGPA